MGENLQDDFNKELARRAQIRNEDDLAGWQPGKLIFALERGESTGKWFTDTSDAISKIDAAIDDLEKKTHMVGLTKEESDSYWEGVSAKVLPMLQELRAQYAVQE